MLNTRLDKEQARSIGLSCRQSEIIYATFLQPPESCESSVRNTSALDFKTRFALSLSLVRGTDPFNDWEGKNRTLATLRRSLTP